MSVIVNDFARCEEERVACTPIGTLHRGRRTINQRFEMIFSWDEICHQFTMMKNRYKTFMQLERAPRVFWGQLINIVHANFGIVYVRYVPLIKIINF